jgi:acetyl esterase/lipase
MKTLLLVLALATPQLCQNQNPPFQLPDTVEMRAGLVYASPAGRDLHLDLFLPKSGAGPFPAVVYIHGGGWSAGNRSAFRRQAAYMATKGFAGACIEYRLSGEAHYPAALHDAKAAVRWMRANAAKYRIQPDQIAAAGGSAGGHLVAMLGATGGMPAFEGDEGNSGYSSRVQAVAAFNPALDLVSFGKAGAGDANNAVAKFLGCPYEENPKLWAQATPLAHVSKDAAPFLFLHGTADRTVPYQQSVEMMKKLEAAGVHAEIFSADGAGHGFFNSPPFYEPALKRMEEFFTKTLR